MAHIRTCWGSNFFADFVLYIISALALGMDTSPPTSHLAKAGDTRIPRIALLMTNPQEAMSQRANRKTGKLTRSVHRRQTCRCNGSSCICESQFFELLGTGLAWLLTLFASTQSCTCSGTINDVPHTRSACLHVVTDGSSLRAVKFLARIPR